MGITVEEGRKEVEHGKEETDRKDDMRSRRMS